MNKALAIALFVPSIAALAQSPSVPTPAERFVAASVKPADQRLGGRAGPDHFYTVTTLIGFLGDAFNSQAFLMFDLPDSSNERWEVSAKSERGPMNPTNGRNASKGSCRLLTVRWCGFTILVIDSVDRPMPI